MKTYILLLIVVALLISAPLMAAKVKAVPVTHDADLVFQSYPGSSCICTDLDSDSTCTPTEQIFHGNAGLSGDVIYAVPGILAIDPGLYTFIPDPTDPTDPDDFIFKLTWSNYVKAAYDAGKPYGDPNSPLTDSYYIKDVKLTKTMPPLGQGFSFPGFQQAAPLIQHGSENIRLWWPLMYELPGTTWVLKIDYGTKQLYDDGGVDQYGRPNGPQYMHTEIWNWKVDATLESMVSTLILFHELPFGTCQIPLISGDRFWLFDVDQEFGSLFCQLWSILQCAIAANGDANAQSDLLEQFELLVSDNCITDCPGQGAVCGDVGITQTNENPACYKLLVDAEYVANALGAFQSGK